MTSSRSNTLILLGCAAALVAGCGSNGNLERLPPATVATASEGPGADYLIGPLDTLQISVWRNPELSTTVAVRPDGRITVPLVEDLPATGKTPSQLAADIEDKLKQYIQDPIVSVMVGGFNGPFSQQVRVIGQAAHPQSLPYRAHMTLLDAMIAVGGLGEYAAGNRARLVRFDPKTNTQKEYALKIESLLEDGETSANVEIQPGDVIIIPESRF